jgi:uncharacterized protein (UPF0297 family)
MMWTIIGWALLGTSTAIAIGKTVAYLLSGNPAFLH